jgi:site-specific recombinase
MASVHELELPPEWRLRWGGLVAWVVFGLLLGAGPVAAAVLTVGSGR